MKRKVALIMGTRPEAIKLVPVHEAFERHSRRFTSMVISTGQHREMLDSVFTLFGTPVAHDLAVMTTNQTLGELTARLLVSLGAFLTRERPAAVIVQGDTTTCMAASLAAYYEKIPVVHVEAGLRTHERYSPFPEEMNRRLTGALAEISFAPTERARAALQREGISAGVYVVGNTVIDSLMRMKGVVEANLAHYRARWARVTVPGKRLVLVTGHRRESFGAGFEEICEALRELSDRHADTDFVYPVHLNPNVHTVVHQRLGTLKNIHLIDPVAYDDLVYLLSECFLVLTDSGGIQEEAPTLRKPVIVMRDSTERPEAVEAGCAVLAGARRDAIVNAFERIFQDENVYRSMTRGNNPYGDGHAAEAIVRICEETL